MNFHCCLHSELVIFLFSVEFYLPVPYRTPLQAFRGEITVKLDVYSFGAVLLELLTSLPAYGNSVILEIWRIPSRNISVSFGLIDRLIRFNDLGRILRIRTYLSFLGSGQSFVNLK